LPITSQEFYNMASFEIEMTGAYHDFGTFVSYVANFPFIANISHMEIKANDIAISAVAVEKDKKIQEVGKKRESMTATFILSTYFVKDEERLKEIVL